MAGSNRFRTSHTCPSCKERIVQSTGTADPPAKQPEGLDALRDWAEEAWRFLASDFSDTEDKGEGYRKIIVRHLGDALEGKPVPSSLADTDPEAQP